MVVTNFQSTNCLSDMVHIQSICRKKRIAMSLLVKRIGVFGSRCIKMGKVWFQSFLNKAKIIKFRAALAFFQTQ